MVMVVDYRYLVVVDFHLVEDFLIPLVVYQMVVDYQNP
jgi:hypothetical protein